MNIIFVINLIYLLVFSARPAALKLSENEDINTAERSGKKVNSIAKRSQNINQLQSFVVKLPKTKTKPKQTQTKPIFQRSIFDFSKKMRIFDKFRTYFLCKTKPIWLSKNLMFYT